MAKNRNTDKNKVVAPVTKKLETLTSVVNITNQKQVVEYNKVSYNIPARGKIQLKGNFEEVYENLLFWVELNIITITKN